MKSILSFLLILSCSVSFAEDRQRNIDSLENILAEYHHQDTTKVNLLNSLSTEFYEMDKYDSALMVVIQAKLLAERIGFKSGKAFALRRMGAIQTEQGLYPMALECLLQSLHIYQSLKDNQGIFMVNNNIGTVYYFQQDYTQALEYYFKSYKYKADGLTCANIGMVYIDEGNYNLSLQYFYQASNAFALINDRNNVGTTLINVGSVYDLQNKNDSALIYYFQALKIKNDIQDYKGKCDALGSIGDIYLKQSKYSESLKYQLQSLELSNQIGYANGIKLTEEALSNLYDKLNQPAQALKHHKLFIAIRDSMFNEEATKMTVRSEMNFQAQKERDKLKMEQDKKDAIQNEILKRRQVWIIAFSSGFGLILIFSFFQFLNYKKIRRAKDIIAQQNELLEHQKKEVTDSINYAKNIQQAILPSNEYMRNIFPNHFLIYKPKDILSGDFYWTYMDDEYKYIAVADSTGHGIPASLLTMIGTSLLNEIVIERKVKSPELILNALREEIIKSLNKQGASQERKDGMDISIMKIPLIGNQMQCACANNSIYIIRNKELIEIKSDRFPVGKYIKDSSFTLKEMYLQEGDVLYGFSDGFSDQFGQSTGKKLMSKRFKLWLIELSHLDMEEIQHELEKRFNEWKGTNEQIDDVTVMAVKI